MSLLNTKAQIEIHIIFLMKFKLRTKIKTNKMIKIMIY